MSSSSLPPEHGDGDPMPEAMSSTLGEAWAYTGCRLLASLASTSLKRKRESYSEPELRSPKQ